MCQYVTCDNTLYYVTVKIESLVQLSPSTQQARTPRRTSESSNLVKTEQTESPKKQPVNMNSTEQPENSIKSPSYNQAAK